MANTPVNPADVQPSSNTPSQAEADVPLSSATGSQAGANVPPSSNTPSEAGASVPASSNTTDVAAASVDPSSATTSQAAAAVAIPSATPDVAAATVDPSSATSSQAAADVPASSNTTSEAAQAVPVSSNTNSVGALAPPRTLCPKLGLNFAADNYSYCGQPKSFEELLTYSRPSSATFINRRMNNCGKYEYFLDTDYVGDVENLALYSEDFTAADWFTTASTVVNTNLKDPDGVQVQEIFPDTGSSRSILQTVALTTVDHTISFTVKANGVEWIRLFRADGGASSWFNIKYGYIGTTNLDVAMEFLSDGWYKISLTGAGAVGGYAWMMPTDSDGVNTITADNGESFYASKTQLTESAKPLPYVKTLSTAVTETFTESPRIEYDAETGESLGYLSEGASTNILVRSEDFSTTWFVSNSAITTNQAVAPDKTKSADLLNADTAGSDRLVRQITTQSSSTLYAYSVFIKAGSQQWVRLANRAVGDATTGSAWFDVQSGTAGTLGSALDGSSIKYVGDGWYRCTIIGTTVASIATNFVDIAVTNGNGLITADLNGNVNIWGAQLEELPFPSSYIRTEGAAVSRSGDDRQVANTLVFNQSGEFSSNIVLDYLENRDAIATGRFAYDANTLDATRSYVFTSGSGSTIAKHGDVNSSLAAAGSDSSQARYSVTHANGTVTTYTNGIQFDQVQNGLALAPDFSSTLRIGSSRSGGGQLFGHIKQLDFYDLALTAQEVELL